jgi:pimeloyl-ACP methyl ester carboxylesterase
MDSIVCAAQQGAVAPVRVIWLPGAFHGPEGFLEAGFHIAARARHLPVDLQFMRIDLEHVGDRAVIEKLAREVVAPARAAGCRSVWLAGISLGGFFALDYAAVQAGGCDGLCLLAPYLGSRQLIAEIATAPSLDAWDAGPLAESDEERRIWRFIRDRRGGEHGPEARPLYLGYGREDRFARGHALLAKTLPPGMVHVAAGGHDWPTWSALWEQFLTLNVL